MLAQLLSGLPPLDDPNVIVGTSTADDAGVYRLSPEVALVHSVDFFTPIVDDPRTFGRIAAANALSDIYAMGARPLSALAIAAFPESGCDIAMLAEILAGGDEKAREAGINVIGGHTVKDAEPKYGLAVTGIVHPDRVIRNSTARPGDMLVLTKPLGTGILTTAFGRDLISTADLQPAIASMEALNRAASQAMIGLNDEGTTAPRAGDSSPVHAATDVTGFGLVGHLQELARGSGVGIELEARRVPLFERVLELAIAGCVPAGSRANHRAAVDAGVKFSSGISQALQWALCDAQTSGGLLVAVAESRCVDLVAALRSCGVSAAIVGKATPALGFAVI